MMNNHTHPADEDNIPFDKSDPRFTVVNKSSGKPKFKDTLNRASKMIEDFLLEIELRKSGLIRHLPTSIACFDKALPRAFHQGQFAIIAARPGGGKTVFAQQTAENIAESGNTVLFFSLEMSESQLVERSVIRRSGLSIEKLQSPNSMSDEELGKFAYATQSFSKLEFYVDDKTKMIDELIFKTKVKSEELKLEGKSLGIVLIDYIQLIHTKKEMSNKNLEIGEISEKLRLLAKELNIPVVALAQLNRGLEQRANKRPIMSDIRDCGNIEQDADLILAIYRDDMFNPDADRKGIAEIIAMKNRHGPMLTIEMEFVGELFKFQEIGSKKNEKNPFQKATAPMTQAAVQKQADEYRNKKNGSGHADRKW